MYLTTILIIKVFCCHMLISIKLLVFSNFILFCFFLGGLEFHPILLDLWICLFLGPFSKSLGSLNYIYHFDWNNFLIIVISSVPEGWFDWHSTVIFLIWPADLSCHYLSARIQYHFPTLSDYSLANIGPFC